MSTNTSALLATPLSCLARVLFSSVTEDSICASLIKKLDRLRWTQAGRTKGITNRQVLPWQLPRLFRELESGCRTE